LSDAAVAAKATPRQAPLLRRLHRASALFLLLFIAAHIANHLAALGGISAHVAMMQSLRLVYRAPMIEPLLLAAVTWQMASGLMLVMRSGPPPRRGVARLQAASGVALLAFLAVHVGAVLAGRARGLDTGFHFAAAGFHAGNYRLFFAPYYFAAILFLFIHLGCALYWRLGDLAGAFALGIASALGAVLGLAIVLALAGAFYPVQIPDAYRAFLPL
jgi:succinate dehydrogenase/fumarate reductase cytochrome b subunit